MNNETFKNLSKLRISGMLSEAARREAEQKILGKPEQELSENDAGLHFI